jgi:hypothetical protein
MSSSPRTLESILRDITPQSLRDNDIALIGHIIRQADAEQRIQEYLRSLPSASERLDVPSMRVNTSIQDSPSNIPDESGASRIDVSDRTDWGARQRNQRSRPFSPSPSSPIRVNHDREEDRWSTAPLSSHFENPILNTHQLSNTSTSGSQSVLHHAPINTRRGTQSTRAGIQPKFRELRSPQSLLSSNRTKERMNIVESCISSSGNTVCIVGPRQFCVFRVETEATSLSGPLRCVGLFGPKSQFQYGLDKIAMTSQALTKIQGDVRLHCGAVSDTFVALGSRQFLVICSMEDRGRSVFQHDFGPDAVISKLLFDHDGQFLVAVYTIAGKGCEMAQMFTLRPPSTSDLERRFSRNDDPLAPSQKTLEWSINVVIVDGDEVTEYPLPTRDASLSFDGKKIALCSHHAQGIAVIRLLIRMDDGAWKFWGLHSLELTRDHRDSSLSGITGITLYRFILICLTVVAN